MKRLIWSPALLALLLVACGGLPGKSTSGPQPPEADTDPVAATDSPSANAADEATGDESGTIGDDMFDAATDAAGKDGTTATPDPTVVALAASFELPLKGDPDAPLRIYEFSDYI